MLSFYLIWSLSYFTLHWWMSRFWAPKSEISADQTFVPAVTLLIPFRNEAENIPGLCLNLKKLTYPDLQILLIDDHSEDNSLALLQKTFKRDHYVRILKSGNLGKKSALEVGVKEAKGQIMLCTDADCEFAEDWVESMVLPFQDPKVQLVTGTVMVEEKPGFLADFQAMDWASILVLTNYSFAQKKPLMCSAANLAYRKEAFEEVNGYEGNRQVASGDDEFLLKKIHAKYGKDACHYLVSADTSVKTKAEPTWDSLISQRVRWASKWRAHFSISHACSAIAAFLIQLVWIGSVYLVLLGAKGLLTFGVAWLIKIAAEKLSLGKVLKTMGRQLNTGAILQISVVHPFYVLRVGIAALSGKFTWKGREN
ncbi:Glycosyltransferase, catalytic subunit of cellulose synthase and poly-beta-1,6-N-acetylglucosamine synthase [Algoriphagus locisalis]|uniref:Glycosyltransferase, catalytic subunit of cellulose synthase and poly-beta-1,6-N-acetylglucosamine synthase n=1 Tax=Algoriphagus locisalis TaxID=305507 RepID=A0A1I6ZW63_9BACT|nr:glycosyltransferase [Algoriphagus locisalis]SFT66904.1 Glycosyltransferase, catalytic subunit of cellulose synthase and poly-beta-1,6-N-acetylglucosamine synthase [Algoriphagus locisalis]